MRIIRHNYTCTHVCVCNAIARKRRKRGGCKKKQKQNNEEKLKDNKTLVDEEQNRNKQNEKHTNHIRYFHHFASLSPIGNQRTKILHQNKAGKSTGKKK